MTLAFIKLAIGLLLLTEVCTRMFKWTNLTDLTYWICRPFWIPIPMRIGIMITLIEVVVGTILTYNGLIDFFV